MCAGGCHELRCIRNPGRDSQRLHRALGGTRILLAAAPPAPPCFCRWQRSSLLHKGFLPAGLFGGSYELRLPLFPQPLGRALKKRSAAPASPPCFRRRRRSAPLLFESTLASPFSRQIKQKLRYPLDTGVLGGRGWITRAALLKTAHWAVFSLSSATAPQLFESTLAVPFARQIKQKLRYPLDTGVLGGAKLTKSEPLPSGASLAAISSKVMVFVPSL